MYIFSHICAHTFFFIFFFIVVYLRILNIVSVLYGRTLLSIHPLYTGLHLLIPNSKSIPLTCLALGNHQTIYI